LIQAIRIIKSIAIAKNVHFNSSLVAILGNAGIVINVIIIVVLSDLCDLSDLIISK